MVAGLQNKELNNCRLEREERDKQVEYDLDWGSALTILEKSTVVSGEPKSGHARSIRKA